MDDNPPIHRSGVDQIDGIKDKARLTPTKARARNRRKDSAGEDGVKRRCVSTACIACRKDGVVNRSSCAHR